MNGIQQVGSTEEKTRNKLLFADQAGTSTALMTEEVEMTLMRWETEKALKTHEKQMWTRLAGMDVSNMTLAATLYYGPWLLGGGMEAVEERGEDVIPATQMVIQQLYIDMERMVNATKDHGMPYAKELRYQLEDSMVCRLKKLIFFRDMKKKIEKYERKAAKYRGEEPKEEEDDDDDDDDDDEEIEPPAIMMMLWERNKKPEMTAAQKEEMAAEYTAKAATMRAVKGSDTRMCEMLEGEREAEE